MNICKAMGCQNVASKKGLCNTHYARVLRHGELNESMPIKKSEKQEGRKCSVEGCNGKCLSKGFCQLHYNRFKINGDTGGLNRITAKSGEGHITKDGYRIIRVNGVKIKEHRYVMEQKIGRKLTSDENVHHKNGIRWDNRENNLELWSTSQPKGQKVIDKISWAKEILDKYKDIEKQLKLEEQELVNKIKYN